jgi:excisionase family DNA binding protein
VKQLFDKMIYTAEETAHLLGLGMNKVYELLANKSIPSKRIGRRYLIPKSVLEKWLNENTVKVG